MTHPKGVALSYKKHSFMLHPKGVALSYRKHSFMTNPKGEWHYHTENTHL